MIIIILISDQSEADRGWFLLHCLIITPASQTGASLIRNCQTNDDDDDGEDEDDGYDGDDAHGDDGLFTCFLIDW